MFVCKDEKMWVFNLLPAATTTAAAWPFMLQTASFGSQSPVTNETAKSSHHAPATDLSSKHIFTNDETCWRDGKVFFRRLRYGDIKRLL